MPVQVSYPGVYVQEVPSGVRTITGVSTSIALFVGMARRGRLGKPEQIKSFADYERAFGTDTTAGEMTEQVRQFFLNGGQQAWITRIADGATEASVHLRDITREHRVLTVTAKDAGSDGHQIQVEVDYDTPSPEATFNLAVFRETLNPQGKLQKETVEKFPDLSMNPKDGRFVENVVKQQSTLVDANLEKEAPLPPLFAGYSISGILCREEADVAEDPIVAINGDDETITVAGDRTLTYPIGVAIRVSGSAIDDNNDTFNSTGATFDGSNTVITTDADLSDEGDVGAIVKPVPTLASDINRMIDQGNNTIRMKVDDGAFRTIVLPPLAPVADPIDFSAWQQVLDAAFPGPGVKVSLTDPLTAAPKFRFLKFQSTNADGGSVVIEKSPTNDLAVPLQLGVDQGGLEVDGRANQRPAPTGFFADLGDLASPDGPAALAGFANAEQADVTKWTLKDASGKAYSNEAQPIAFPGATASGPRMYNGSAFTQVTAAMVGSLRNVQENLSFLGSRIQGKDKGTDGAWTAALQGHRLALKPTFGGADSDTTASLTSEPTYNIGADAALFDSSAGSASVQANVKAYRLGSDPVAGEHQESGTKGDDGKFPKSAHYEAVFPVIDREVDLFNLMILPRAVDQPDDIRGSIWGPASVFCHKRRAFLLVDPLSDNKAWSDVNQVTARPTGGVDDLRRGLVGDHAAIYWPRLLVSNNGTTKPIDPSGAIAGLMARTDANRGVWKAPAGLEATIRGVRGVEYPISDPDNGDINREAVNAIRVFPNGIVSWGARTLDGFDNSSEIDYKYVPVRRLALFIEESLYRGLKFAVFEPNDEPLWAQIRLAAGAFMNNLFRQGAFQGQKAGDAYLVKVDSETTTQNDINLGIVNVVIGFAPLKPAEFVIITIRQLAGQVQVQV